MIMCIQNLALIGLFVFKILNKNSILTSIKGSNSVANLPKFELIQLSCMSSLPARMRMIDSKMKELECSEDFSHYKSMGIFPYAQGQLTPQSLVRSNQILNSVETFMVVLLTCKNEEDPIKNRGARVFTTLYINFSDAQGPITLELVVVSGRNLNSSKLSCMSSLPARMRLIE